MRQENRFCSIVDVCLFSLSALRSQIYGFHLYSCLWRRRVRDQRFTMQFGIKPWSAEFVFYRENAMRESKTRKLSPSRSYKVIRITHTLFHNIDHASHSPPLTQRVLLHLVSDVHFISGWQLHCYTWFWESRIPPKLRVLCCLLGQRSMNSSAMKTCACALKCLSSQFEDDALRES